MEPIFLQEYAAQTDWLVADWCRHVAHQHEIVTNLECAGRNSRQARKLLLEYEGCLALLVADRDRLHRHLGI